MKDKFNRRNFLKKVGVGAAAFNSLPPEPATLLLLGLGGLVSRRKK